MRRRLFVITALSLLLLILLSACGGGEKTPVTTVSTATPATTATLMPSATTTPTATLTMPSPTVTPTPAPTGPVKIGGIGSWSGPGAISGLSIVNPVIKLVEWQVKQQGGILGGRDVSVVTYDNRASVPEAQNGAIRLVTDDKVSALVWGGISQAEMIAVGSQAEELKVLFVTLADYEGLQDQKFVVNAVMPIIETDKIWIEIVNNVLKAKTVAYFAQDLGEYHTRLEAVFKPAFDTAGVKIVFTDYANLDTLDFMSYLTRIKYANPDVIILAFNATQPLMSIAKQIADVGGWGDIKVITTATGADLKKRPGTDGWYMYSAWVPQVDYPGSVKFINDFETVNKSDPTSSHVYFYNCLWTAINAIQLAGTDNDRVKIAEAARSGKLEWDTPMGHARFSSDGFSGLQPLILRIENGELVIVPTPD